jgi:acylphosphatase
VADDIQLAEVCIFLNQHYIEDDDGQVKLYNDNQSLRYALMTPGYHAELHFCVRNEKNNRIMAVITGTPKRMTVFKETVKLIEGNFLTVHKALRKKKLASVMMDELARRKRLLGYKQAFFTSPDPYPTPF